MNDGGANTLRPRNKKGRKKSARLLLRFALLLLADADLEVRLLGFLESLVVVARDSVVQIVVDVSALGQDRHQGEALFAFGTKRAEPFYVGNCHNVLRIACECCFGAATGLVSK